MIYITHASLEGIRMVHTESALQRQLAEPRINLVPRALSSPDQLLAAPHHTLKPTPQDDDSEQQKYEQAVDKYLDSISCQRPHIPPLTIPPLAKTPPASEEQRTASPNKQQPDLFGPQEIACSGLPNVGKLRSFPKDKPRPPSTDRMAVLPGGIFAKIQDIYIEAPNQHHDILNTSVHALPLAAVIHR